MFLDVAVPAGKEGHSYAGGTVKKANLLLLAIVLTAANCFAQYSYQAIDFTGAVRTRIFAVNNRGEFVGAFWDTANNAHAIFFDGKDLARVDPNGVIGQSTRSWAYALNISSACFMILGAFYIRFSGMMEPSHKLISRTAKQYR